MFIATSEKNYRYRDMLRIAVQSKGRLFEDTMALLQEAGIKVGSSKRTLLVQSSNFPIEVLYLRDDDIPQTVASGVADIGIVGENESDVKKGRISIVSPIARALIGKNIGDEAVLKAPGGTRTFEILDVKFLSTDTWK